MTKIVEGICKVFGRKYKGGKISLNFSLKTESNEHIVFKKNITKEYEC